MMRLRAVGDDPTPALDTASGRAATPGLAPLVAPDMPGAADAPRVDPLVVAAFDPDDPLAAGAAALRGQIAAVRAAGRDDGAPVRLVSVIGIEAEVEAALLAANLAVVCARAGETTLLIDAAVGRASQHSLFRLPNRAGVTTLLAGLDATAAIRPTAIPGLSLLASGPTGAGERGFDRARLYEAIRAPIERFAITILLAPGDAAGAAAASERSDGVVLVARRNLSGTRALRDVVARLDERGTPIIGTVRAR